SIKKGSICKELSKALARKGDTINILNLRSVRIIPPSFLKSLINLKTMSIYNDYDEEDNRKEIKEFNNILQFRNFQNFKFFVKDLQRWLRKLMEIFHELIF